MEIKVNDKIYEYLSDYPDGWRFAKGDYFKFPVAIGPANCFIKRFEKRSENIVGWNLLQNLIGESEHSLSKVYDVASVIENNKIVHYIFFEFVSGQTLYDCVLEKAELDLERFTEDLFSGVQILQKKAHWFPDFCEKNIFCSQDKHFLLIDLDSAQPISDLPDNDMWGSKEYWALVFNFCRSILNYKGFLPSQFNGTSLNYLNIIFLVLRLRIFYTSNGIEYDSMEFYNNLPRYLNDISPSIKEIFNKIYKNKERPLKLQEVKEIKDLVLNKIVNLSEDQLKRIMEDNPDPMPVINNFSVNNYLNKISDYYTVENGRAFALEWDIENEKKIEIHKDGKPFKKIENGETSIEIIENVYDASEKLIEYTLVVRSSDVLSESVKRELKVKIVNEKPIDPDPVIIEFAVRDYIEKNKNYYVVESGNTFTLGWSVKNAQEIEIQKNGTYFKKVKAVENSLEVTESSYDGKQTKIIYTLTASAGLVKTQSEPLNIIVKESTAAFPIIKYFKSNKYNLRNGGTFILNWDVQNATEITLFKDSRLCKEIGIGEKSIEFKENYEGKEKAIEYKLHAANGSGKIDSKPVIIAVKPAIKLIKIIILAGIVLVSSFALYYILSIGHNKKTSINSGGDTAINVHPIDTNDVHPIDKNNVPSIDTNNVPPIDTNHVHHPPPNPPKGHPEIVSFNNKVIYEGETITITVKNFAKKDNDVSVKFNDKIQPQTRIAKNGTLLYAQVPTLDAGTNHVSIYVLVGKQKLKVSDNVTYKTVNNPSPVTVPQFTDNAVSEGVYINLRVNNLNNADKVSVMFNKTTASIVTRNPTDIRIEVPSLERNINTVSIFVVINGVSHEVGHDIKYIHNDIKYIPNAIPNSKSK
jgi:hypothetical protein